MNNTNKQKYQEPTLAVIVFESRDIITTSGFPGDWMPIEDGEGGGSIDLPPVATDR